MKNKKTVTKQHKSATRKLDVWPIASLIILTIQTVCIVLLLKTLAKSGMLPQKMLLLVCAALMACIVVTTFLMFYKCKTKKSKWKIVRRILSVILSGAVIAVSIFGSIALGKVSSTIDSVTKKNDTQYMTYGVYVLSSSPAASLQDIKDETIGVVANNDKDNIDNALHELNAEISNNDASYSIKTSEYQSMTDEAQALYDGTIHAMFLKESFTAALTELDQFNDFDTQTKLLAEIKVEKKKAEEVHEPTAEPVKSITERPFILYVSGSDTRSEMLDTSRSDVNILMTVNPVTKQILLLNTPRDYYIGNPAGGMALDKLTHLGIYGIDNSIQGLEALYNINVDYYVQINFTGFERLIDSVGGITINSETTFTTNEGYTFYEGPNQMDGAKALSFARDRYHQQAGDNDRGKHQMMVIQALIDKITSNASTILMNYSDILDSLSGMMITSLSSDDISSLVKMQLNDMASWNVQSFAVTGTGGNDYTYSMPTTTAYVMYQNPTLVAYATSLINKVENGETLTAEEMQAPE